MLTAPLIELSLGICCCVCSMQFKTLVYRQNTTERLIQFLLMIKANYYTAGTAIAKMTSFERHKNCSLYHRHLRYVCNFISQNFSHPHSLEKEITWILNVILGKIQCWYRETYTYITYTSLLVNSSCLGQYHTNLSQIAFHTRFSTATLFPMHPHYWSSIV